MKVLNKTVLFYDFHDFLTALKIGDFRLSIALVKTQNGRGNNIYCPKALVKNLAVDKDTVCDIYFILPEGELRLAESMNLPTRVKQEWSTTTAPETEVMNLIYEAILEHIRGSDDESAKELAATKEFDLFYKSKANESRPSEISFHLPRTKNWSFDRFLKAEGITVYRISYGSVFSAESRQTETEEFEKGLVCLSFQLGGYKYIPNKDQVKVTKKRKAEAEESSGANSFPKVLTQEWDKSALPDEPEVEKVAVA